MSTTREDLSDFLQYLRSIGSGTAHDIAGGYAGIGELVRSRNADAAAEAVRKVQERSYTSPGAQKWQDMMARLGGSFAAGPSALIPENVKQELGTVGQGAQNWWEQASAHAPGPAAIAAGVVGAGVPELGEEEALTAPFRRRRQQLIDPLRQANPGIFKDPRQIAREAEAQVAPENPMMKRLWGYSRGDLYDAFGNRQGNIGGVIPGLAANPTGSEVAGNIITPGNTARMQAALQYAPRLAPNLTRGMVPWYVLDPMYQRLRQMYDEPEALRRFGLMNYLTALHSPNSAVVPEIARGSAAYMLNEQGRFPDWLKYGGNPTQPPLSLEGVPGHRAHSTAQAAVAGDYLANRLLLDPSAGGPKTGLYAQSSSIPQLGFQTNIPVGDVHWTGAIGLQDVRPGVQYRSSATGPELHTLSPWWEQVTEPLGYTPVSGQAQTWGLFSPQTGVRTQIGAPKLELITGQIEKAARRLGVSPETARDLYLQGKTQAGTVDPDFLKWLGLGAAGAAAGAPAAYNAMQSDGN